MRWGTVCSGLAATLFAGPAIAEPSPRVSATVTRSFQSNWETATPQRPVVRIALSDRMELVASGRKDKSPAEQFDRRNEGPARRSRNPKMARVGLILHW